MRGVRASRAPGSDQAWASPSRERPQGGREELGSGEETADPLLCTKPVPGSLSQLQREPSRCEQFQLAREHLHRTDGIY